jgi:LytS/YehU family sensor histidine kinase
MQSCPVSDSAVPNLQYSRFSPNLTLRHCWAHWASLLRFNINLKLVLNGSEALYACSHAQCQIRQCQICSTADSNLTLRHCWAHWASLLRFNINLKLVLNGSEALYACSHAQCQILQCRICSTADSAAPNLTLRHCWAHEASLLPFNTN